jgi:nucleoside-diphosphate-sugar epimerase
MKVIITGSTGMVGKAVLIECLESNDVEEVLVVNRNPLEMEHPKLREVILKDFSDVTPIKDSLAGYDACFYCMGVSAVGMSKEKYYHITYSMTEAFARALHDLNPGMIFNYVSGTGTDSSEEGRMMWARVKGKTENMVLNMGFKDAYAFRPGIILPEKGVKSKTGWYNAVYVITRPLFPLLRKLGSVISSPMMGQAMINSVLYPIEKKFLENKDIKHLARR